MRDESPTVWPWLTRLAFALAIVVVIVRATMLEYLRDPFDVVPGDSPLPRGPGPGTSLVLDLLATLPALLVAARAALDRTFQLRRTWGNLLMLAVAVWTLVSAYRGDDRFAALIGAAHILAALSLLWAIQQTVRSWRRLRLVAAFGFGLLLVYLAHGVIDKYIELPMRQENWERNSAEMLKIMNVEPGSFQAEQLRKKIGSGELLGFAASINTYGAMLVTLAVVSAGVAMSCARRREDVGVATLVGIGVAATLVVITWTDSRTALATPVLAAIALAAMAGLGWWLREHRKLVYVAGVVCVLLGTVAVIGIGLKTGGLLQDSMSFRWRYWVGAFDVWQEQPLLGVGFDSFQYRYLEHRLPVASEEVKDPHNFIVRAFVEGGIIAGLLVLAWVAKALWDMTMVPQLPAEAGRPPIDGEPRSDLGKIALVCIAGMLLAFVSAADWDRPDWNLALDALKRLLYVCMLTLGVAIVALRSLQEQVIDDRPAPWIRGAMTVAVLVFLVHNLIDFSMFETGAMFTAALIAGAAWGVGLPEWPEPRGVFVARAGGGIVAFIAAAAVWAGPTIVAESSANFGDDLLRANRPIEAAGQYRSAWQTWPGNPDYAFRAARALIYAGPAASEADVQAMLDAAIAANPANGKYWNIRAQWESHRPRPRVERMRADYEMLLSLDPRSVSAHLDYARALEHFGLPAAAGEQYRLALRHNDGLDPNDPRRLHGEQLASVKHKAENLPRQEP